MDKGRPPRLRVLVVGDAAPARGGIATYAETIAQDTLLREHIDVFLLNTTRRPVWKGGSISIFTLWRALVDLVRVFRTAHRFEIVHLLTALLPMGPLLRVIGLAVAARAAGARVLVHAHTGQANIGRSETFEPGILLRFTLRGLHAAHVVAAVSEAGRRGLRRYAPGLHVEVLPNPIQGIPDDERRRYVDPPWIVYAGALGRAKGLLDLLESVKLLRAEGRLDARLAIIGGANQLGEAEAAFIRSEYRKAGLSSALLGEMEVSDVRRFLRRDAVAVMSSHSEGQPIFVMEAMAAGVPVVATDVGAVPDMVEHGSTGFIVPPRDPIRLAAALQRLIDSPEERARMGTSGRARFQECFSPDATRDALLGLYSRVGSTSRRA